MQYQFKPFDVLLLPYWLSIMQTMHTQIMHTLTTVGFPFGHPIGIILLLNDKKNLYLYFMKLSWSD